MDLDYINTLNATGANIRQNHMLTENNGNERVKAEVLHYGLTSVSLALIKRSNREVYSLKSPICVGEKPQNLD